MVGVAETDRVRGRGARWWVWGPALVLAALLACAAMVVMLAGFTAARFSGPRVVSPDGRYEAWVYSDNCGATCPYHTILYIRDRNQPMRFPLFRDRAGTSIHTSKNSPCRLYPAWRDARTLVVAIDETSTDVVYAAKTSWNDVAIDYYPFTHKHRQQLEAMGCDDRWRFPSIDFPVIGVLLSLTAATLGVAGFHRP